jgi:hypothetical protein
VVVLGVGAVLVIGTCTQSPLLDSRSESVFADKMIEPPATVPVQDLPLGDVATTPSVTAVKPVGMVILTVPSLSPLVLVSRSVWVALAPGATETGLVGVNAAAARQSVIWTLGSATPN